MNFFREVIHAKVYEPKKRLCGGKYGWVRHRFPIKDGISFRDTWIADIKNQRNPMFDMFSAEIR